ncbi:MAG: glycogen-binding domain-containing protein [Elusimicrobiales bacterium]|nr:glycogen-binding domain-containing protein [Elusimicrobiales bacterium]
MKRLEKKDFLIILIGVLFVFLVIPIPIMRKVFSEYFGFLDRWVDKPMRFVKKSIVSKIPPMNTSESGDMNFPSLHVINIVLEIDASNVLIVGDFTKWRARQMIKGSDKKWSFSVPVVSGNYRYIFLVDGKEVLDPLNPEVDFYNDKKVSVIRVK